jgi:predicted nicotinamide N-methyase|eukprot:scaffold14715_cov221-Alexandrium_tamarense.AAC.2
MIDSTWREHRVHAYEEEKGVDEQVFLFNLFEKGEDETLIYEYNMPECTKNRLKSSSNVTITLTGRSDMSTSTGLAVWGGAEVLCRYIAEQKESDMLISKGSRVLELGAGLGLCGLLLAQCFTPATVVLSDGDVDVLKRLVLNTQQNASPATVSQLVWGQNLNIFKQQHGVFDVILATDCVYMTPSLFPLWKTIDHLLCRESSAVFIYVNVCASQVPMDKVLALASQFGFTWTQPTHSDFRDVFMFRRKVLE